MIKACKVTVITDNKSYIRNVYDSLSNAMKTFDRNLEKHRQWIGIPAGEKIIEVKYSVISIGK